MTRMPGVPRPDTDRRGAGRLPQEGFCSWPVCKALKKLAASFLFSAAKHRRARLLWVVKFKPCSMEISEVVSFFFSCVPATGKLWMHAGSFDVEHAAFHKRAGNVGALCPQGFLQCSLLAVSTGWRRASCGVAIAILRSTSLPKELVLEKSKKQVHAIPPCLRELVLKASPLHFLWGTVLARGRASRTRTHGWDGAAGSFQSLLWKLKA